MVISYLVLAVLLRRHDIQHNDIQDNNIQDSETQHNDKQHNDNQYNKLNFDIQNKRHSASALSVKILSASFYNCYTESY